MTARRDFQRIFAGLILLLFSHSITWGQGQLPEPETGTVAESSVSDSGSTNQQHVSQQQISYALGLSIGNDMKADGLELDAKSLVAGIIDALAGNKPRLDKEEVVAAMQQFQQLMRSTANSRNSAVAQSNQRQADVFLEKNALREGVQQTASGLQYEILESGAGSSPTLADTVLVHYVGTLLNKEEFDSSVRRGKPSPIPVKVVIPGWKEALQKMKVGDKWRIFVPPQLAYGANPPGPPIEPNSLLIFEVELLGIQ